MRRSSFLAFLIALIPTVSLAVGEGIGEVAWPDTGSGDGGHTIEDEGTPLTQRSVLNFTGDITCTDDAIDGETDCNVTGAGAAAALTNTTSDLRHDVTEDLYYIDTNGNSSRDATEPFINPTWVAHDAAEVTQALTNCTAGQSILMKAGTYKFTAADTIPNGCSLLGEGQDTEYLCQQEPASTFTCLTLAGPGAGVAPAASLIGNFTIGHYDANTGHPGDGSAIALDLNSGGGTTNYLEDTHLFNLWIDGDIGDDANLESFDGDDGTFATCKTAGADSCAGIGINVGFALHTTLTNINVVNFDKGVDFAENSTSSTTSFIGSRIRANSTDGMEISDEGTSSGHLSVYLTDTIIEGNGVSGIDCDEDGDVATLISQSGGYYEQVGTTEIDLILDGGCNYSGHGVEFRQGEGGVGPLHHIRVLAGTGTPMVSCDTCLFGQPDSGDIDMDEVSGRVHISSPIDVGTQGISTTGSSAPAQLTHDAAVFLKTSCADGGAANTAMPNSQKGNLCVDTDNDQTLSGGTNLYYRDTGNLLQAIEINADAIGPTHLTETDFGDFSVASDLATLDIDVVGTAEMADEDHGDFTYSAGQATLDTDVVDTNELLLSMTPVWTGDHDFGGGGIEIENGTTPPACTVGQIYLDTDATSGQQLMACEGGTFVLQGDGGGSGDVESVGDCTSGACLDGTSDGGTQITFYDAGGNAVLDWDGTNFDFSVPVTGTSFTADPVGTPGVDFTDSDTTDGEVSGAIDVNCTTTATTVEDCDYQIGVQLNGSVAASTPIFLMDSDDDDGGAGTDNKLEIGNAVVNSIQLITDGTGDAEVALPTGAISTGEILDGTITTTDIDADTILAGNIATNAVGTLEIEDGVVSATDLATNSVDGDELVDGSVDTTELDDADTPSAGHLVAVDNGAATRFEYIAVGSGLTHDGDTLTADLGPSIETVEITDGNVTENKLAATLAFDDGDLLDFTLVEIDAATNQGLILPGDATTCTGATGEGQICWDRDDNSAGALWIGDGTTARQIAPPGGGITSLGGQTGSTQTFSSTNATVTITSGTDDHDIEVAGDSIDQVELAATLTMGATDYLDFTAWENTDGNGLTLPTAAACANVATEGQVCWESDVDTLWIGDGAAPPTQISGGSGITSLGGQTGATQTFSSTNTSINITSGTDDHDIEVDVTPSVGSATLEISDDAVQVKYGSTLTEGASGLDVTNVSGVTGADEDALGDDLITALSGVTTVTDGSWCQGDAGSAMNCDVVATDFDSAGAISDNAVDGTDFEIGGEAQGAILYYDGTDYQALAVGTDGQQLETNGAAANPSWEWPSRIIQARKNSAGTIAKGTPVYVTDYNVGGWVDVETADADTAGSLPAIGLAREDLTNAATGTVQTSGLLLDLDTSSFSAGDDLYVDSDGDTCSTFPTCVTATAPTGESNQIQKIGEVVRDNITNGTVLIFGAGRTNATPNLDSAAIFVGSSGNVATAVDVTGDVSISNTGVTTYDPDSINEDELAPTITLAQGDTLDGTTGTGALILVETQAAGDDDTSAASTAFVKDVTINEAGTIPDSQTLTECVVFNAGGINCDQTASAGCATTDEEGDAFDYTTADFDSGTDEGGSWVFWTPANLSGTNGTLRIAWTSNDADCDGGTGGDDVIWTVDSGSYADSADFDAGALGGTLKTFAADTCLGQGDVMITAEETGYVHGLTADQPAVINLTRDADNVSDNYDADARLINLKFCYEVDNVASGE